MLFKKIIFYLTLANLILIFFLIYINILDVRYASDDVCRISHLSSKNLFHFISDGYIFGDGRFNFWIIFGLLYRIFGVFSSQISIFLILLVSFFILNDYFSFFIKKNQVLFLFFFLNFFIILSCFEWFRKVFFNKTLIITYFLPLILSLELLKVDNRYTNKSIFLTLLPFFLSGFHEIITLTILFLNFLLIIYSLLFSKNKNFLYTNLRILFFSLIGALIMYFAPGNKIRRSKFINSLPLLKALEKSLLFSSLTIIKFFTSFLEVFFIIFPSLLFISSFLNYNKKYLIQAKKNIWTVFSVLILNIFSTYLAMFYIVGEVYAFRITSFINF